MYLYRFLSIEIVNFRPFYFESGSPYVWLWVTLWELCYLAGIISVLLISSWILGNLVVAATSDTLRDIAASSNEASYTENTLKVLQSVRDAKSLEDILLLGFFFLATSSGTVGLLTLCMLAYYHMLPEHNANYDGQINHNSEVNEANIQNINSVPLPLPNPEVPEEESHHSVTSAHSQLQSALSATHISSVEHPSTPDHISLVNGQAADPLGPPIRPDGTAPIEQAQVNIENGLSSVSHWEIARFILVYIVTGLLLSIFLDPSMLFIRGVIGLAFLAIFVFALPSWLIIRRTRKKIISTFRVLDLDDPRLYCHSPPSSPSSHCVDCPIPHSYRPDGIFQSAISGSASASASKFSRPVLSCYSSMRVSVGVPGIVPTNDPRDTYYVALDGDPQ